MVPNCSDVFPYRLLLGVDQFSWPFLLPIRMGEQIIVTEAYGNLFRHLLLLRIGDEGAQVGAVITGQPGIGVSLQPDLHPIRQLTGGPSDANASNSWKLTLDFPDAWGSAAPPPTRFPSSPFTQPSTPISSACAVSLFGYRSFATV